jgi:hypothetical protein
MDMRGRGDGRLRPDGDRSEMRDGAIAEEYIWL